MKEFLTHTLAFFVYFFAIIGFVTGIGLMTGAIKYYQEPYPFTEHKVMEFGIKSDRLH